MWSWSWELTFIPTSWSKSWFFVVDHACFFVHEEFYLFLIKSFLLINPSPTPTYWLSPWFWICTTIDNFTTTRTRATSPQPRVYTNTPSPIMSINKTILHTSCPQGARDDNTSRVSSSWRVSHDPKFIEEIWSSEWGFNKLSISRAHPWSTSLIKKTIDIRPHWA